MGQVKGVITKVVDGKTYESKFGTLKNQNVTITNESGQEVTVQRGAKPESNGQGLVGKIVHCTYTTSEIETRNGTMTIHKTDSKGFVLEQQGGFQGYTQGYGAKIQSTSSTGNTSVPQKSSYNSEGARHGMIVGNAVELAGLRKNLTLDGLLEAARDVLALTQAVESGELGAPKAEVKTKAEKETKKAKVQVADLSDEAPF